MLVQLLNFVIFTLTFYFFWRHKYTIFFCTPFSKLAKTLKFQDPPPVLSTNVQLFYCVHQPMMFLRTNC
jgi:hypothetical protein